MYHHTESMVAMAEDMMRQANQMEKEVKMMLEMEGRACGIELDRRKNARALMEELMAHQNNHMAHDTTMCWAYVPEDTINYDTTMPADYMPPADPMIGTDATTWNMDGTMPADMPAQEPIMDELDMAEANIDDPMMHTHGDGTTHSHEGGDVEHTHDDTLPSEVEPNQT